MKKENKILDATTAVVAGILTELIYSEIFPSYYEKQTINDIEVLSEKSLLPFWAEILIVISLFLVISIIVSIILPRLIYKVKSTKRKYKPTYNTREIIDSFEEIKKTIQTISFVFNNGFSKISFAMLYSDDIANCINKLYTIFCPIDKVQKKTVEFVFRNSTTINTKGNLISKYELISLISVVEKLFEECMKEENIDGNTNFDKNANIERSNFFIFKKDVEELKKKLDELKSQYNMQL